MKIKNLAFFGIMASILSIGGAHALTPSDTTGKSRVIASQAYVDAHKNDTDVHVTTAKKANWDSAYSDTSGAATSNALAETDGTKLTKVSSIKGMVTTSVAAEGSTSNALVPSETAVRAAIEAAADAANTNLNALTARVTTNEGNISTNASNISTNTSAIATINGDANTTGSIKKAVADEAAIARAAEQDLDDAKADKATTLAGYGITDAYTQAQVNTELAKKEDTSNKVTSVTSASTDAQYPSAKAVYDVSAAAATDTAASATWDDTDEEIKYAASGAAGNTTKLATSAQVSTTVKALEASVNKNMVSKDDATVAAGKTFVQPTYTVKGNLETLDGALAGIAGSAFQSVDSTGTGEAVTTVTQDTTDKTQVNVTKSLLTYKGAMDSALGEINGDTSATCTTANPCILSYTGSDYKWTQMVFPTTPESN